MSQTRREVLRQGLLGGSWLALRAAATGLPVSLLVDPLHASAATLTKGQDSAKAARFLILSLSTCGDPLNANVPGCYSAPDIVHPVDPRFAATTLTIAGQRHLAAAAWKQLPQRLLDRTVFFHHATLKTSHPSLPELLQVHGDVESAPVLFARELSQKLQTVQDQPLLLGSDEVVMVNGQRLRSLKPTELRDVLLGPDSPLPALASLRSSTLERLQYLRKKTGNVALGKALSAQTLSLAQAKALGDRLTADLTAIKSDGPEGQVLAAAVAVRLGMAPVVAIHIPLGGDNHFDDGLKQEATEIHSGIGQIALLWNKLGAYGMAERTCFAQLSVFGRTLKRQGLWGRDHWPLHNAALLMGAPFRGGVVGGVVAQDGDYGAAAIDSRTGIASERGDITVADSQPSLLRTLGQGVGIEAAILDKHLPGSKPIRTSLT
jgi:hypothetical protein